MTDTLSEIHIPEDLSEQYGFLSNDSNHGFYDANRVWWSTVTHYIEAKKFEGTNYENEIRECRTPLQVKRKSRARLSMVIVPRGGSFDIESREIYGNRNTGATVKEGWKNSNQKRTCLWVAIQAKFKQNLRIQTLLKNTGSIKIVSSNDNGELADILTKTRNRIS